MQCRTITNAMTVRKIPVRLRPARGYFILEYDNGQRYETKSVMVCRLSQLTLGQWVEEGRLFASEIGVAP